MSRHILPIIVLMTLLLAVSPASHLAQAVDDSERVYQKTELPEGTFLTDPKNESRSFYLPNLGLYFSADKGQTWRKICSNLKFESLFIHPDTGKLFAIINITHTMKDETDGIEKTYYADKIMMSDDGEEWKDISGKEKRFSDLLKIFQDPDVPDRVCVIAQAIRGYILQSIDDEYTKWNWYRSWEWDNRFEKSN